MVYNQSEDRCSGGTEESVSYLYHDGGSEIEGLGYAQLVKSPGHCSDILLL